MLVLSRKVDEQIQVGNDIFITVVEVRGDKVRIGIDAPKDVSVHRKEVVDAITRDGTASRFISTRPTPPTNLEVQGTPNGS